MPAPTLRPQRVNAMLVNDDGPRVARQDPELHPGEDRSVDLKRPAERQCAAARCPMRGPVNRVPMARIWMTSVEGRYLVTMSGHLSARDLRRLEQMCGPALEQPTLPLTLRLKGAVSIDPPARAYLHRLIDRGAVLQSD